MTTAASNASYTFTTYSSTFNDSTYSGGQFGGPVNNHGQGILFDQDFRKNVYFDNGATQSVAQSGYGSTRLEGVSASGLVYGYSATSVPAGYSNPGYNVPFTFDGTGFHPAGNPTYADSLGPNIKGIDNQGTVYLENEYYHANLISTTNGVYNKGQQTYFPDAQVFFPSDDYGATYIDGVTGSGVVWGHVGPAFSDYISRDRPYSFIYENGNFTYPHLTLADGSSANATVADVNEQGGFVGTYVNPADQTVHSFVDRGGVYSEIAVPGSAKTTVFGINDKGVIFGSDVYDAKGDTEGFIYANGVYTRFVEPDAVSTVILGVSDETGNVTGNYVDAAGVKHGFFAQPSGPAAVTGDNQSYSVGAGEALSVSGSGDVVTAGAGAAVSIGGNSQNASDARDNAVRFLGGGTATVTDNARAELFGDGITAGIGGQDTVGIYGRGNKLTASGSGDAVWVGGNGRDASDADNNQVTFAQGGTATVVDNSRADLFGDGLAVQVNGNDLVGIQGHGAQVSVAGADSAVFIGGNGAEASDADLNRVGFAQGGRAYVTDNARVAVSGDGLGVSLAFNDTAYVSGTGNTIAIAGPNSAAWVTDGGDDLLLGSANADSFGFGANFGADVIQGFQAEGDAHDTLTFSSSVFASVAAILQAATQVGSDVVITASDHDVLRLQTVSLAALSSSNLRVA